MLFDSIPYLSRLDPSQQYTIDILTGGMTNVTLRATKTASSSKGRFSNQQSLVMKYAPPFVASVGEKQPITTFRQASSNSHISRHETVIEGRALSLFSADSKASLRRICTQSSVGVPELLHHDVDSNVLIMSDIGPLPNLASIFAHLGGSGLPPFPLAPVFNSESIPYFTTLGTRLGIFFAKLHSPATLSLIQTEPDRGPNFFDNPDLANFAFENGIVPIGAHLLLFPQVLSRGEAEVLFERVSQSIKMPLLEEEKSFALADCWPGIILVTPLEEITGDAKCEEMRIAVVHWEFANIGRGVNNDIAQFLARLALLHTAAVCKDDVSLEKCLVALAAAIERSYRDTSIEEGAPWTVEPKSAESGEVGTELDTKWLKSQVLRSTFLTFGAEMMRCAFVKEWNCEDERCLVEGQHTSMKEDCQMIKAMVEKAVSYFRAARDDEQSFYSKENMTALQKEKDEMVFLIGFL